MAKSVLDIVIKLSKQGGADKETVTGLVKVKSAMLDAAAVAGTLVAAGIAINKAYQATGGVFLELAEKVRDTSRATSLSAEESSRLIQVTDDLGISYETLAKAIKSSADSTDFSIEGLAKASDQYLQITDANDRATFAQKLYGKAWVDMVAVLEKGSTAIRNNSDAISDSLILKEKDVRFAEENRIALDNLNDTQEALAVTIGAKVVPAYTDMLSIMTGTIQGYLTYGDAIKNAISGQESMADWAADIVNSTMPSFMRDATQAQEEFNVSIDPSLFMAFTQGLDSAGVSYRAMAEAAQAATSIIEVNYSQIISMTQSISDAQTSYAENVATTNADISLTDEERKIKLQELAAEYEAATNKIVAANFLQQLSVDGVTQAEFEMYTEFQVATGAMTASAATQAQAMNEVTLAAANGTLSVQEMKRAIDLLQSKTITLTVNQVTNMVKADSLAAWADKRAGYAEGTDGWKTVPPGYPNDSYPIGLTSGETFSVVPAGGAGGSGAGGARGGGSGGNYISVVLNVNSVVSMADREEMKKIQPYIFDMLREAQAQGVIR